MFHVDYLSQGLTLYMNDFQVRDWGGSQNLPGVVEGSVVRIRVEPVEPLRLELASFIRAAATGSDPEVGGEDGIRALRLALMLVGSGEKAQVRNLAREEAGERA